MAEAAHSDGIGSFVLTQEKPMPWAVFARAMDTLMPLRGPDLLRVKGFLNVEGCKGPVVVQFVQHLAHPPVELERWPDENRQSRVVFITRNISEQQVRDLFKAVRRAYCHPAKAGNPAKCSTGPALAGDELD